MTVAKVAQTVMPLFQPVKLGAHELKHRVVMAPLTRCRCGGAAGPAPGLQQGACPPAAAAAWPARCSRTARTAADTQMLVERVSQGATAGCVSCAGRLIPSRSPTWPSTMPSAPARAA